MIKLFKDDFTGDLSKWNQYHFFGSKTKNHTDGEYHANASTLVNDATLGKQVLRIETRPKVSGDSIPDPKYVFTGALNTLGKAEIGFPFAVRAVVKLPQLIAGTRFIIGGWNESQPGWQHEFNFVHCEGETPTKVWGNYNAQWSPSENGKRVSLPADVRNFLIDPDIDDNYHEFVTLVHPNYLAWYVDGFPIWSIPNPRIYDKWIGFYISVGAGYDSKHPATTFDPLYTYVSEFSVWRLPVESKAPFYPDFKGKIAPPDPNDNSFQVNVNVA